MKTKKLEITSEDVTISLTVQPSNVMVGLLRNNKQTEADAEKDPMRWFARYWLFAACVSCSSGEIIQSEKVTLDGEIAQAKKVTQVNELTFDEYYALSDAITIPWMNDVFEVNPHWMPSAPPTEEEKKKA